LRDPEPQKKGRDAEFRLITGEHILQTILMSVPGGHPKSDRLDEKQIWGRRGGGGEAAEKRSVQGRSV
jgi:hypothetical protein